MRPPPPLFPTYAWSCCLCPIEVCSCLCCLSRLLTPFLLMIPFVSFALLLFRHGSEVWVLVFSSGRSILFPSQSGTLASFLRPLPFLVLLRTPNCAPGTGSPPAAPPAPPHPALSVNVLATVLGPPPPKSWFCRLKVTPQSFPQTSPVYLETYGPPKSIAFSRFRFPSIVFLLIARRCFPPMIPPLVSSLFFHRGQACTTHPGVPFMAPRLSPCKQRPRHP